MVPSLAGVWQAGTTQPDGISPAELVGAEFTDWQTYVAFVGGEPAAIGALRTRDGIGVLASAATRPEFRDRGCQTALLHQRLADATRAGCDLVIVQTNPSSVSQRNLERLGFRTAYTQSVWLDGTG